MSKIARTCIYIYVYIYNRVGIITFFRSGNNYLFWRRELLLICAAGSMSWFAVGIIPCISGMIFYLFQRRELLPGFTEGIITYISGRNYYLHLRWELLLVLAMGTITSFCGGDNKNKCFALNRCQIIRDHRKFIAERNEISYNSDFSNVWFQEILIFFR